MTREIRSQLKRSVTHTEVDEKVSIALPLMDRQRQNARHVVIVGRPFFLFRHRSKAQVNANPTHVQLQRALAVVTYL